MMAMLSGCETTSVADATAPVSGGVVWVVHATYASLFAARAARPGAAQSTGKLGAFATYDKSILDGGSCEIHTLFPGGYPTERSFGADMAHEFRHCVEGNFHEAEDRRRSGAFD
jgi:hypothetical protein